MARKRGEYGQGSVYPLPDGRWRAALSSIGPDGKRKRRTAIRKDYRQALSALKEMRKEREQGVTATTNPTLADYLTDWLASVRPTLRPRPYQGYESIVRVRIVPRMGAKKLNKLAALDIQRLYAELAEAGLSSGSIRNTHAMLNAALQQAVDWGMIARNPCTGTTPPRPTRHPIQPFTESEMRAFLTYSEEHIIRYHQFFVVAVTTGMRVGELIGLRWRDIDWEQAQLHVVQQRQFVAGRGMVPHEPKTKPSRRTIHLSELALSALRAQRRDQLALRLILPTWPEAHDLVFTTSTGQPMHPGEVGRSFHRVTRHLGLHGYRPHDLRHTCATLLLSKGVHPKIVSEMLGHSSIAITLDIYSHYIPAMHQAAAETMDELLG